MIKSTSSNKYFKPVTTIHNREEFSRFYDQNAAAVYGHLLRQTANPQRAALLLEETFMASWHRRSEWNQREFGPKRTRPLLWLLCIAHEKSLVRPTGNEF